MLIVQRRVGSLGVDARGGFARGSATYVQADIRRLLGVASLIDGAAASTTDLCSDYTDT